MVFTLYTLNQIIGSSPVAAINSFIYPQIDPKPLDITYLQKLVAFVQPEIDAAIILRQ